MSRASEIRSLEQAKAAGADVRPIASPRDAVRIAQENSDNARGFPCRGFRDDAGPHCRDDRGGNAGQSVPAAERQIDLAGRRRIAGFGGTGL